MQTTSIANANANANAPRPPKPRSPGIPLDEASIPRHWFAGNVWATQVANGVNLLFPAGERFFVRSVNHFAKDLDPALAAQVRGFFGQEGRHAKEHERFFEVMEAQGYDIARFLRVYEAIAYGFIERVASPNLRLATTAACEHFTAILAEHALRKRVLDHAAPPVRSLLLWHAAEEIEHRSVAFDVLKSVAPSYPLRLAGLAMASLCLGGFWIAATTTLLAQEPGLGLSRLRKDARQARANLGDDSVFRRGIREYMRRDFHPSQSDTDRLAADYLESVGLT